MLILRTKRQFLLLTFPDIELPRRQVLLLRMAFELNIAKIAPVFNEFCHPKAIQHLEQLWKLLSHLTSESNEARTELSGIVSDTQGLPADMFSVPCEFGIEFP